ncbi:MAG: GYDIA family GHMP kinase [Aequorivita sp.]
MKSTFYSNGKLLLTGEYVVLDGATALAVPTKYGQSLEVEIVEREGIHWKSFDEKGDIWFEDIFDLKNLEGKNYSNPISDTLSQILREAKKLNPKFLSNTTGIQVETKLDFPRNWGLGTSSTLINNIAQWAKIDGFSLLANSFGGSGYDVAAAQRDFPIFYKLNKGKSEITKADLDWNFIDSIFFVHLNRKQDSRAGIARYNEKTVDKNTVLRISEISEALQKSKSLLEFENLIDEHELLISKTLGLPPIKEQLFNDYPHSIKSLGAWGGDFVMVTGNFEDMEYFKRKGYHTIIPFVEMTKLNR